MMWNRHLVKHNTLEFQQSNLVAAVVWGHKMGPFILWVIRSHGNVLSMAVMISKAHQDNRTELY